MTTTKYFDSAVDLDTADTATTTVRGVAGLMAIIGMVGCLTPLAPLGAVMAIVGGFVWLLAPATEPSRQAMVAEVESGGSGCGPALATVALIVVIMALAGLAAFGVVVGGGL